ncbi:hypothetical protein AAG906_019100 [Vitis piasezkii]
MPKMLDAWRSYSCTALRVACFDITMTILSMREHTFELKLKLCSTPYSLVYGMKTILLVEIEMGLLRVALEQTFSR